MPGLVIDIVDLPRPAGSVKSLHLSTPAPAQLGNEVIGVLEGSDLDIEVTLTSMDEGVLAQARAQCRIHGECVRCLRDLDEERTVSIDELYFLPEAIEAQRAQGDEEAEDLLELGETTLDLEPALRDAIIPTLPLRPLCRPECPGLCPECGERMEDLPADHHHEVIDPRWAALAGFMDQAAGSAGPGPESGDAEGAAGDGPGGGPDQGGPHRDEGV
ncbi:YceD family protein [Actinomyces bowdenii]|uniref:DUF177 domain-containing protein n=1 Tax=Actinomyces bowdenii TaxID=131109 RepID=A0A853ES41_9ACTO|nr:DUF177 domain-containing protein [Actinomyces bowdenii]MBF0698304.1 DUF177 domain-containing protein [Actinomyces bowdenii]NYS70476.1 DUF177 domain-containing protein [Actinomyces bowdenii]